MAGDAEGPFFGLKCESGWSVVAQDWVAVGVVLGLFVAIAVIIVVFLIVFLRRKKKHDQLQSALIRTVEDKEKVPSYT